jgi:hypothetical protein
MSSFHQPWEAGTVIPSKLPDIPMERELIAQELQNLWES